MPSSSMDVYEYTSSQAFAFDCFDCRGILSEKRLIGMSK